MNQLNNNKSFLDILRDTEHNAKANLLFLKLLAKQKKEANPFDIARTQTWNPSNETKAGGNNNDTI